MVHASTPSPGSPPQRGERAALRAIALFEAAKGLAALAGAAGLLDLMHHDVRRLALELIGRFGADPHAHFPSMLLHYADQVPGLDLHSVLLLAAGYVALRWAEAWGLWHDRRWGELLGALSGGLYVPFELTHLLHRPTWAGAAVLGFNLLLVAYLTTRLWRQRARLARP
jgi:uncharacterized membrane protein (DUF2068 family)